MHQLIGVFPTIKNNIILYLTMKKFTTLFLCLLVSLGVNAQENKDTKGVAFSHGSLAESLAKAKANKKGPKLVFMDCYTSWCGPCKYMANTIFPMEVSGNFFNTNFVNIKIDMEKGEGVDVAKKYGVNVYPTFLILDANGNEINRVVGSTQKAEEFIEKIKVAMDINNTPKAKKAVYDANKSIENAMSYMDVLSSAYMEKDLKEFLDSIFTELPAMDKYSEKMWPYVSKMMATPDSKVFEYVLDDKNNADMFLTKEKVDNTICVGLKGYAYSFISGRMQNPDKKEVVRKVSILNLLSVKDETAPCIVNIVKLYADNKIDEIAKLLNVQELTQLNANDQRTIEGFIFSIKDFPKEKKADFMKAMSEYYQNQTKTWNDNYQKMITK